MEYRGCSHGVAFGPEGNLFRIGCDYKIYQYQGAQSWQKLADLKAFQVVADQNGLWVIEMLTKQPFTYDFEREMFKQLEYKELKLQSMAVGKQGQLVGSSQQSNALFSIQEDGSWQNLQMSGRSFTFSKHGRFFLVQKTGNSAWM